MGRVNCKTEYISKWNSSNALKWFLISFVKAAKERFTKHFVYDEYSIVEDKYVSWFTSELFLPQEVNKYHKD